MKKPNFNPDWTEDIKRVYRHDLEEMWEPSLNPPVYHTYQKRLNIFLDIITKNFPTGSKILDVGCAQATLSLILAEKGYNVTALDIRQGFIDYAATRYEYGNISFICENFLKFSPSTTYDVVILSEIVEHTFFPFSFIKKAYNLLNSGGMIILSTPNKLFFRNKNPSFREIVKIGVKKKDYNFSADGDMHFFAFTPLEIKKLVEMAGFRKVGINFINSFFILGHFKTAFIYRIFPYRFIEIMDRFINHQRSLAVFLSENILLTGYKI